MILLEIADEVVGKTVTAQIYHAIDGNDRVFAVVRELPFPPPSDCITFMGKHYSLWTTGSDLNSLLEWTKEEVASDDAENLSKPEHKFVDEAGMSAEDADFNAYGYRFDEDY